jgi:nucleotide-binding universal stress UspA family protein
VPVVVAKFRGDQMNRVLVPVAAGAPLQATGLLCRALGSVEGTDLTFLHVVSSDAPLDDARTRVEDLLETRGVASLGSLILVASHNPVEAIVEEAIDQDLVIVGPSGRPGLLSAIFSNKSQRIAEEAACSVLLVWNRDVSRP